jgi:hypothetical protein
MLNQKQRLHRMPRKERKTASDVHYILAFIGKPLHAVAIIRAAGYLILW